MIRAPRGPREIGRRRRGRGLSSLEIVIVAALGLALVYAIYVVFLRSGRPATARDPRSQAMRAAYYVARRIRSDLKWAQSALIEAQGARLVLVGPEGEERRVYEFDRGDNSLKIPQVDEPGRSAPYNRAQFRDVLFLQSSPHVVKYVIAAFPLGRQVSKRPSKVDRDLTTVLACEGTLDGPSEAARFPYWSK